MCADADDDQPSPVTPLRPFRIGTGQPQLVLPDEPPPEYQTGAGSIGDASTDDPTV